MTAKPPQKPPPPRLCLTPEEAAAALGISRDSLDRHVLPNIRVVRLGTRVLIPTRELERWIDRQAAISLQQQL